jgi:hypothetical protein
MQTKPKSQSRFALAEISLAMRIGRHSPAARHRKSNLQFEI